MCLRRGSWTQNDQTGGENCPTEDLIADVEPPNQTDIEPVTTSEELNRGVYFSF